MSFAEQLSDLIAGARTYQQFDDAGRLIWKSHAAGLLDAAAATAAAETLRAKQLALRHAPSGQLQKPLLRLPKRRAPRSPDRAKSIARRRRCAASGSVPAVIAAGFTQAENAVLATIAGEIRRKRFCDLCNDIIAAKSGVSRTVVQNTLRQAKALGLIRVQERPRRGAKNLSNVVTITSSLWRAWLKLDGHRVHKSERHGNQVVKTSQGAENRSEGLSERLSGSTPPLRPAAPPSIGRQRR